MMQSRTHTCGELRLSDAGKTVTLCGWMENMRVVGSNFAFVVLRDFYGTTQIVVETEDMMNIVKSINKESTISVTGAVRERASKNPRQATGDVEVVPEKIDILGKCIPIWTSEILWSSRTSSCAARSSPRCARQ